MADISAIKLPDGVTYNIKDKSLTNLVDGSATGSIKGIGNGTVDPDSYEIGEYSFVEGYNNIGSGNYVHAEGNSTHATGPSSHSEGISTIASGEAFHAEGYSTQAIPIKDNIYGAHAEGNTTYSKGNGSHSEGVGSRAEGDASHAEGNYTVATGFASHADGKSTIANHSSQHTFGEYNIEDASTAAATSRGNYVEIVGNGTAYNKRSNARTLDWSGNEVLAGKLTVGAVGTNSMDVATVGQLPTVPANIVNTITTTAGAHTAISSQKGNVSFNVPTKTSHLTNDSGYITNAGVTGVKGNAESSYRTGQVNLTAANIGAIPSNNSGNTQNLLRPLQLNGLADVTLDAKINTLRANRLAFLPADQIIIEKTTDGGSTWTDAGVADSTKVGLFSETRAGVTIPLLNGVKNINCGLRITITGMKYNVPSGTAETSKYNYWNSNYIVSTERYNQLKEMYFWVSANSDTISVKVERATGAASTTWNTIFDNSSYGMTGWSGNDYIRFAQGVFGGGTNQTSNYWNYRLTFFTRGPGGSTTLSGTNTTSVQVIQEIRGYGDTWWTAGNEYAANDKIYTHDYLKNVIFPAKITASGGFSGALTGNVTGNVSGSAGSVAWSGVTSKPTTLSGYGITDAKISNGTITLGSNTITPLTSYTETDPVFTASAAYGISITDITNWNGKSDFSGSYNDLTNKPTIPDELADLTSDSTHRTVTDTEKSTWNGKSDFSGSYNDLVNKPIFIATVNTTTYSEVEDALADGKTVFALTDNTYGTFNIYEYMYASSDAFWFKRLHGNGTDVSIKTWKLDNTDTWSDSTDEMITKAYQPIIIDMLIVASRSYSASTNYWFSSNNVAIPQKTGYTPVAAVGASAASSGSIIIQPLVLASDTSTLYGFARNVTSAAVSTALNIPIMYVRTDLL